MTVRSAMMPSSSESAKNAVLDHGTELGSICGSEGSEGFVEVPPEYIPVKAVHRTHIPSRYVPRNQPSIIAVQRTSDNLEAIFGLILPTSLFQQSVLVYEPGRNFLLEVYLETLKNRSHLEVPTRNGREELPVGNWYVRIEDDDGTEFEVLSDREFRNRYDPE